MKNIKFLFLFVFVLLVYSSCTEEDKFTPTFESQLYFQDTSPSVKPLYEAGATANDTLEVLVLGKAASAALSASVDVVDSLTTAIEGVHYRLLTESINIPSGSFSADLIIEVIFDGFESPEDLKTLTLTLNGETNDNATATIELGYNCVSDIPTGTYVEQSSGNSTEVTLTKTGDNVYVLSNMNFDYYNPDYADIPGTFIDECGVLTLQGVQVPEAYNIAWIGSGSFDAATGTLTFDHSDATYNAEAIQTINFVLQ